MAFDEIKKLAQALDDEIGRLDDEAPSFIEDSMTFDDAVAESEEETLLDKLNDLTARNEELEDRVVHQNFIIDLLSKMNSKLYSHISANPDLEKEMGELSEILQTYVNRNAEIENLSAVPVPQSSSKTIPSQEVVHYSSAKRGKTQLKLTVELGEMQMTVSELKGALSMAVSKHEDHLRVRSSLEQQRREEQQRRITAEKQRDAYARAYEESMCHFKKIVHAKNKRGGVSGGSSGSGESPPSASLALSTAATKTSSHEGARDVLGSSSSSSSSSSRVYTGKSSGGRKAAC